MSKQSISLRLFGGLISCLMICVAATADEPAAPRESPTYKIYTASIPPYTFPDGPQGIGGTLVPMVEEFFHAKDLPRTMALLPWSAAFRRARTEPDAVIFPLDRIESREDQFHWIKPLVTTSYYLYGLKDKVRPDTTIADIAAAGELVSCTRNSIQCELLLKAGLPNENILRIEGASITRRFTLIVRERNFYTVYDPLVFENQATKNQLNRQDLIQLQKIGERTSYLAASKIMPEDMLARLK